MPRTIKRKKRVIKRRKNILDTFSRGSITIALLIGIVIVGAVYFVGGIFPKVEHIDIGEQGRRVVIDTEADPATGAAEDALRLRTIKFKPCSETAAVDFLLDRTSSMTLRTPSGEQKMDVLKDAVISFIDNLSDSSVIGVQYFSSADIGNLIEIQLKKDAGDYAAQIRALPPLGNTPTHDGLAYAYNRLQNGVPKYPEREFAFIFVSDGQPVPPTQDPRLFNPDPSQQIKDLGVEVYSIGILDQRQIASGQMKDMLTHIASSPENVFISPDGQDLEKIVNQIGQELCE